MQNNNHTRPTRCRAGTAAALCTLVVALPALAGPDLPKAGLDEYPLDDAIVLRLDENWALMPDGAVRYEYHRWLKLLNNRLFYSEGDPRIGFRDGTDKVEIVTARTHLPVGGTIDVPDYAYNMVSPAATGGLAAFADDRQWVISFSALQPDAILELHYVRTSMPGAERWVWGDLRLRGSYPVLQHNIAVALPAGQRLRYRLSGLADEKPKMAESGKNTTYTWRFSHLDHCANEPGAPTWQQRCGRLRFTSCPGIEAWVSGLVQSMNDSTVADQAIKEFVAEIASEQVDTRAKIRALYKALHDRFNLVHSEQAWWGHSCRNAADIFAGNYGTAPEAAALLATMFRAAGLDARPMIAVDENLFDQNTPVDSSAQDFLVSVGTDDGTTYVSPSTGILQPAGVWAERALLDTTDAKGIRMIRMSSLPGAADNRIAVRADIDIDADGKAKGKIRIHLAGRFADFETLRENGAVKRQVSTVLTNVLDGFKVDKLTDSELLPGRFTAEADIVTDDALPKVDDKFMLAFSEEAPHSPHVHLPLARTEREASVHFPLLFSENVHLVVKYPEKWKTHIVPIAVPVTSGPWGSLEQSIATETGKLVFQREIRFQARDVSPMDFATIRETVNLMRGQAARHLLLGTTEE